MVRSEQWDLLLSFCQTKVLRRVTKSKFLVGKIPKEIMVLDVFQWCQGERQVQSGLGCGEMS